MLEMLTALALFCAIMRYALFSLVILLLESCAGKQSFDMVLVEGGTLVLGNRSEDSDSDEIERCVTLKDFYISRYEVTQSQWKEIMNYNPSTFKGGQRPVESVSFDEVQKFIKRLNGKTGLNYRLPTEQEWEYAARGGVLSKGYIYSGGNNLSDVGWSSEDSLFETSVVGKKRPNELGIYDMTGNVYEWVGGVYEKSYYMMDTSLCNHFGHNEISLFRGGSWDSGAKYCRNSNRNYHVKKLRHPALGFRLARDVE